MIDTHCHFDLMKDPVTFINNNEKNRIITIGMTNLPSHFKLGYNHVKNYNYIRLALGLHPLLASNHDREFKVFEKFVELTSYIGEVGLDFSREGIDTKSKQLNSFEFVLSKISNSRKIVSLHSRRAEKDVFEKLIEFNVSTAIFHWYSGNLGILKKIAENGFYFSIISTMIKSENGKKIIAAIPSDLILTETDSPFITDSSIPDVINYLSLLWKKHTTEVESIIAYNFNNLIQRIK